jgi:hypothetical protein
MALANMAYTQDELEAQKKRWTAEEPTSDMDKYPYGLSLCLCAETLAKLGITELPDTGTMLNIRAVAKVQSTSSRDEAGGGSDKSMTLQITQMEVDSPTTDEDAANTLYGGK